MKNAQSNYEIVELSLAQRNPKRVGEAASSANAWEIILIAKYNKVKYKSKYSREISPSFLKCSTSWSWLDRSWACLFVGNQSYEKDRAWRLHLFRVRMVARNDSLITSEFLHQG